MIGAVAGLTNPVLFAVVTTLLRILVAKINPALVNALRCAFATATLLALFVGLGRPETIATQPLPSVLVLVASGLASQGAGDLLFLRSMKLIGTARALPISGLNPLFTLFMAVLFLGEQLTWLGAVGFILVVCGIPLLAIPYGSLAQAKRSLSAADSRGVLAAVAAAFFWASSTIMLKLAIADVDLIAATIIRMATGTIVLTALATYQTRARVPIELTRRKLALLVVVGILTAFGTLTFVVAAVYLGAGKATVLSNTAPLFGLPISFYLVRERVNSRIVVGTLLAVAGVWFVLAG